MLCINVFFNFSFLKYLSHNTQHNINRQFFFSFFLFVLWVFQEVSCVWWIISKLMFQLLGKVKEPHRDASQVSHQPAFQTLMSVSMSESSADTSCFSWALLHSPSSQCRTWTPVHWKEVPCWSRNQDPQFSLHPIRGEVPLSVLLCHSSFSWLNLSFILLVSSLLLSLLCSVWMRGSVVRCLGPMRSSAGDAAHSRAAVQQKAAVSKAN